VRNGRRHDSIAIGKGNLELTAIGLASGGSERAGLEDCLYWRRGDLAHNIDLVKRTAALAQTLHFRRDLFRQRLH
jgi:uncharacterized protein (DUF849 family)